jgi:hypothetical protein
MLSRGCRDLNLSEKPFVSGSGRSLATRHASTAALSRKPRRRRRPPRIQNTMYSVHSKGEICDSRDINSPFRYCHMAIQ